jgi:hypothetical protein
MQTIPVEFLESEAVIAYREHRRAIQRRSEAKRRRELLLAVARARKQDVPRCELCGYRWKLEIDHVDGRDWQPRHVGRASRIARYFRELAAGVVLRLLCRSCNGGYNPMRDAA